MKSNSIWRIRLLSFSIILLAGVLSARLFFLQVVKNEYYRDMADRQYLRPASRVFNRGSIYFTTKDGHLVSAATTKQGFTIALNPKMASSASTTYEKLEKVFAAHGQHLDSEAFLSKAAKKDDPYEELATRVEEPIADQVANLRLKNIMVSKERWRYYPASSTASHVIGFMGYKGDDYIGRYGLENKYDQILSRGSKQTFVNFFAEIFSGLSRQVTNSSSPNQGEGDLVLTIEPSVQTFLEKELKSLADKWHPETAGGIVIDPKTGEIVAMAALPNFNPGEKQSDVSVLLNPLVERVYEMGSIIKPLTMAAALDAGAVTANTTYDDKGFLTMNKATIRNFDGKGRGVVSMQEVLNQSLNTGVTFAMQKMGKENFRRYFVNYGLGEKTGIDLPGEVSGLIKNLDNNLDIEFATASFGQGIAMTPIETVRALSSLANGGYLVRPHVVKKVEYKTKLVDVTKPEMQRQVLKKETGEEISRMLTVVVDTKLANGKAKLPHTSVAAKTGTAQIVAGGREYLENSYLHSFFGYFPSYNPRFLVFLYQVRPVGAQYASETLTWPFMDITKFLLNYYEVPPDR